MAAIVVEIVAAVGLQKGCPTSEWIYRNGFCYLIHDKPKLTWSDSRKMCQSLGGDLVLPRSQEENDFVYRKLLPGYVHDSIYTDNAWLRCRFIDNKWDCSDDPSDYTNWSTITPKIGNCAMMRMGENGKWRGMPCSELKRSMCKKPAGPHCRAITCSAVPGDQPRCLTNHTVAEFAIKIPMQCCLACRQSPICRSFNLRGDMCQLNGVIASDVAEEYFDTVPDCVYYE